MSALAKILLSRGFSVSGSDNQRSAITDSLSIAGAKIHIGYSPENLPPHAKVVYSTHVVNDNAEFAEAKERRLPLLHRSQLLSQLMQDQKALLVAGTHGKTTTSSLLTHVLHECGLEPSYAIGGVVHSLGGNGGNGKGKYFVAEACESDGTFLEYPAFGGIVTNIEKDHLDYWETEEALIQGFQTFLAKFTSPQHLLYCSDDERLKRISARGVSYGFNPGAKAHIIHSSQNGWSLCFDLEFQGSRFTDIEASLIGKHNILNSAAVFTLCLQLGVPENALRAALKSFRGVGRRVESKGETAGISVFDDYGHHPTEIDTTLKAMKSAIGERRLIAVFQPHRYTRTRDCLEEFPFAFADADLICVTDIYSAGEPPIPGIDIEYLLVKMRAEEGEKVLYMPRKELCLQLKQVVKRGDVILTIGAGDVTKVGPELLETLS